MNGEGIDIYGDHSMRNESFQLRVGISYNIKRLLNDAEKRKLRDEGYTIEDSNHPNGAFFAYKGDTHLTKNTKHELEVCRIISENGFTITLDEEGKIKLYVEENHREEKMPGPDGRIEGYTHEIDALKGDPKDKPDAVYKSIKHSFKEHKATGYISQSQVAIAYSTPESNYSIDDVREGVKKFKRKMPRANPQFFIYVDGKTKEVHYFSFDTRRKGK